MIHPHERPQKQVPRKTEHPSIAEEWEALLSSGMTHTLFMAQVIQVQCRASGADGGVWLQSGTKDRIDVMAAHPPLERTATGDSWVAVAAQVFAKKVIPTGKRAVTDETGADVPPDSAGPWIVVVPVKTDTAHAAAAAAFKLPLGGQDRLWICRNTLEMTPFLLQYRILQQGLDHRNQDLRRACTSMDILSAFNRSGRFLSAVNVLCNEMAARWQCSRVSIGFLKHRYIRVIALSHTHTFNRKMRLIQDIEIVMEECLDQNIEVVYPGQKDLVCVNRAASQFSTDHGPVSLLSLPLRQRTGARAVMTLERQKDQPFTPAEIETARLTADLFTQRLMELQNNDRWFLRPIIPELKTELTRIHPPRYTLAKCLAVFGCGLLMFLFIAKGDYRVQAPFKFSVAVQQAIVAPFDSYIKAVSVEAGDRVTAGKTILGRLEVSELRLELASLKAEQIGYQKQNAAALRDRKTADAQIALAQIDKVGARIRLLEERIRQGTLMAPITGLVVSKDLTQQIGAPVKTGMVLFEIAAIESLLAELYVPEDSISDIREQQTGQLVAVGHPNRKIGFIVERISPVADVVNQRNIFRVRVRLKTRHEWMRPGMEGMARIDVRKASYLWMATRRAINWLRMALWI